MAFNNQETLQAGTLNKRDSSDFTKAKTIAIQSTLAEQRMPSKQDSVFGVVGNTTVLVNIVIDASSMKYELYHTAYSKANMAMDPSLMQAWLKWAGLDFEGRATEPCPCSRSE